MDGLIMTAQLILGLSILVGLHELGHFLPAKLFGMKVDKFFLFFDAGNFKLFSIRRGETEYGIGWLPLGGYVKIAGMIDESLDVDAMQKQPEPWEFRSKPAWQRLIVMVGGVTVNVITGIIIFIGLTYFVGEHYLPAKEAKYGIVAHPLAKEIGLQTGDKILKVNGIVPQKFSDLLSADVLLESNSNYTVLRNGQEVNISIPSNFVDKISDKKNHSLFVEPIFPFAIGKIVSGMPAEKAGLQRGDKITHINDTPIQYFHELQAVLKDNADRAINIRIIRDSNPQVISAKVGKDGKLGFEVDNLLNYEVEKFSFTESAKIGTVKAFTIVILQVKAFRKMFSGEIDVSKSISGPIGIAKEFGGTWDWLRFWSLTGLLSMVLAFMNLLPIPALDGGHVVFLMYEIITGRKPSDKFLEGAQKVGMVLLLSLMVYAVFNDLFKVFN